MSRKKIKVLKVKGFKIDILMFLFPLIADSIQYLVSKHPLVLFHTEVLTAHLLNIPLVLATICVLPDQRMPAMGLYYILFFKLTVD